MSRAHLPILLAICSVAMLLWVPSASAAPDMCTADDIQWPGATTDPQGVVATHLLSKIEGRWAEPEDVCVAVTVSGGMMSVSVWNTVDGGFPETHLPPGTLVSLGLERPSGMLADVTLGRWRDSAVASNGDIMVIQARTVPWVYYPDAYFGSGLDCSATPVVWPSTFGGWVMLGTAGARPSYAGMFFESDAVLADVPPVIKFDSTTSAPNGLEIRVQGCGDGDPSTFDGFYNGFVPMGLFDALGMTDRVVRDLRMVLENTEVIDTLTNTALSSTSFSPMVPQRLVFQPVPGVVLPTEFGEGRGIQLRTEFSFAD